MHLHCICNPFAMHLHHKRMKMNAKSEYNNGTCLIEYYYNGHEKTLKKYQDKVLVAEWKGDEAKEKWHEVID